MVVTSIIPFGNRGWGTGTGSDLGKGGQRGYLSSITVSLKLQWCTMYMFFMLRRRIVNLTLVDLVSWYINVLWISLVEDRYWILPNMQ